MAAPKHIHPRSLLNIGQNSRQKIRINHLTYAKFLKALTREPCTYDDLIEYSGLHKVTAQKMITALIKEKLVRICDWLPDSRGAHSIRVFEFAPGKDSVARPPKITRAERGRRYRRRQISKLLATGIRQPLQEAA